MSGSTAAYVVDHQEWLAQGDIFSRVLIAEPLLVGGSPEVVLARGPAMLVTHDCAIDKKTRKGVSTLEYLTFLPIHDFTRLPKDRQGNLRGTDGQLLPYDSMYLGELPGIGPAWTSLTHPYSIPALFLGPDQRLFTAAETGDEKDEERIVPTVGDTRVGTLGVDQLKLFRRKWSAFWLRLEPSQED